MKTTTINLYRRGIAIGIVLLLLGGATAKGAVNQLISAVSGQDTTLNLNLKEIVLSASFVNGKRTPLRINSVGKGEIEGKAIGKTYPELVRDIPGVYATSESGSYGDAKINIRGFKQENISVMLNGIPISGLVTGNMFWNNWLGLADATYSIQVQKGIGASMLSDNSVGGTINIITTIPQNNSSVSAGMFYTGYGLGKAFVNLHSGLLKGGWAFSIMGSYAGGSGYVDGANVNSWAYLVNINKKINNHHSLLLTILGSPERHEQRSARLSNSEVEKYGLRYNKNWGYRTNLQTGEKEPFNLSENFYHKPYFTLHHFYTSDNNTQIATSAYLSVGNGGGRWSESKGKRIIDFQKDGQIEWDAVIDANKTEPFTIENDANSAKNILSDYLAGHIQAGVKSNISHKLSDKFTLTEGVHYQFYSTWEKEKITDLLGGNYWYEDYSKWSLAGFAGRNPVKHVGDYIRTDNGKIINHLTIYTMLNYSSDKWEVRAGASAMGSTNKRWDKYNYSSDIFSPSATAIGYSLKGGALYKITPQSSVYLNSAAYSRLPYSDVFFSSGNNEITNGIKNERNLLSELGYRFLFQRGFIEATAYLAYWKNKTIISDPYKQIDNSSARFMIQGLDALHMGLEIEAGYRPTNWLNLKGYASFAKWNWKNDVSAKIYDDYSGLEVGSVNVYSNGLIVGDAPQTQIALFADVKIYKELRFSADWRYNSRLFADFDPVSRQNPQDRTSSLQLPDYHLINMSLSWKENWGKLNSTIYINIDNLLNTKYIERGKDGADHTLQSFSGFWGFGINANIGVRIDMKSFGF